jgi:hypothetical protein
VNTLSVTLRQPSIEVLRLHSRYPILKQKKTSKVVFQYIDTPDRRYSTTPRNNDARPFFCAIASKSCGISTPSWSQRSINATAFHPTAPDVGSPGPLRRSERVAFTDLGNIDGSSFSRFRSFASTPVLRVRHHFAIRR